MGDALKEWKNWRKHKSVYGHLQMTDSLPETSPKWEICFERRAGGHVRQIARFRQSPSEPFLTSGISHHLKNEKHWTINFDAFI